MSVCSTQATQSVGAWVNYVFEGRDESGQGTRDRVAAVTNDFIDRDFITPTVLSYSEGTERKIDAFSLVQSFSTDVFDKDNPEHVQYANDLGYELAAKAAPNTPCVVVTHIDSKGGNVHNHILVANYDLETKGCVKGPVRYGKALQKVNDQVMREHGLPITERQPLAYDKDRENARKRGQPSEPGREQTGEALPWNELTRGNWKEWVADRIDESMWDERANDIDGLIEVAAEKNVSIQLRTSAKSEAAGRPPSVTVALVDDKGEPVVDGKKKFAVKGSSIGADYKDANTLGAAMDEVAPQRRRFLQEQKTKQAPKKTQAQKEQNNVTSIDEGSADAARRAALERARKERAEARREAAEHERAQQVAAERKRDDERARDGGVDIDGGSHREDRDTGRGVSRTDGRSDDRSDRRGSGSVGTDGGTQQAVSSSGRSLRQDGEGPGRARDRSGDTAAAGKPRKPQPSTTRRGAAQPPRPDRFKPGVGSKSLEDTDRLLAQNRKQSGRDGLER